MIGCGNENGPNMLHPSTDVMCCTFRKGRVAIATEINIC